VDGDDALTRTRLDVAEMKGMLTQALTDHTSRLSAVEVDNVRLHGRLTDQGKVQAAHAERLEDLEDDNGQRWGRITGVVGMIVGVLASALALYNFTNAAG
jgi:hypothetical protein